MKYIHLEINKVKVRVKKNSKLIFCCQVESDPPVESESPEREFYKRYVR